MALGDLVGFDQAQHFLGIPLLAEDHRVAHVERGRTEHQDGGVVEGRAADVNIVVLGLQAEHTQQSGGQGDDQVGVDGSQGASYALGLARRSRGVVHHLARGAILGPVIGLSGEKLGKRPKALDLTQGKAPIAREVDFLPGGSAGLGEFLRTAEHLGSRVLDDVGDFRRREVVVDGGHVETDLGDGQVDLEELGAIFHHQGYAIALFEAQGAKPVGHAVGFGEEFAPAPLTLLGVDESEPVRRGLGKFPESEIGHYFSSGG